MQHVLLVMWIYEVEKINHPDCLIRLWETLNYLNPDLSEDESLPEILGEVLPTGADFESFAKALLRDFKMTDPIPFLLETRFHLIEAIRTTHPLEHHMRTRIGRELIIRSIAACRTRLCMSGQFDYASFKFILKAESCYLVFVHHFSVI